MHDDTIVGKEPTRETPRRFGPHGDNVDVGTSSAVAQQLHMKLGRGNLCTSQLMPLHRKNTRFKTAYCRGRKTQVATRKNRTR